MICQSCNKRPATQTFERHCDDNVAERTVEVCAFCANEVDQCEVCKRFRKLADLHLHAEGYSCLTNRCFDAMQRRESRGYEELVHEEEQMYRGMV